MTAVRRIEEEPGAECAPRAPDAEPCCTACAAGVGTPAAVMALSQGAGNRAVAQLVSARAVPRRPRGLQRDLLDTIGDALDLRDDEAKKDAAEDIAEFRAKTFPVKTDHKPTSGIGQFDAALDPGQPPTAPGHRPTPRGRRPAPPGRGLLGP